MTVGQDDFQEQVLRCYTILRLVEPVIYPGWAGGLILSVGLGSLGAAVALAANIAGAVSLSIDASSELCRAALRSGACDFAVNSVDEVLRVMKNEIRRHQPLSVALQMPPTEALAELLERGVKPQLYAPFDDTSAVSRFQSQAVPIVNFDPTQEANLDGPAIFKKHLLVEDLDVYSFILSSGPILRSFDARAAEVLAADPVRHRWSLAATRHFLRERPHRRVLLLRPEEHEGLREEFPQT